MLRAYERFLDFVSLVVKWLMLLMATVIFVVICATVVTRYLLDFVPSWSEEIPRYMLVWISYLGAALCVHYKEHISLDVFFNFLPLRARQVGMLILNFMVGAVGVIMIVFGLRLLRQFGGDLMESIPVTNFWLYLATPTCGALIVLYVVLAEWKGILGLRERRDPASSELIPI
jgi:TRAP-type C4-dicarboxylate transport system permease small subunit